ncbi:hypothetical protein [Bacillus sp. T33-2]|uniref:hypothetical protein n=1 Tax=Bacillus sp. T33-2 TaxID=2054168 RepID=UPI000C768220|nr:hypothetical protein [Bacillus sp. T33-2]PLR94689.1 hypothetical protein CVD19_17160 [Bacillus sp. T33-2]
MKRLRPEQALVREPHPDTFPITEPDQEKIIASVIEFLRKVFPDDSGKWKLTHIYRDKGYINAELRPTKQDLHVFQGKLVVLLIVIRLKR